MRGIVPERRVGSLLLQLVQLGTFAVDVKGTPLPPRRARRWPAAVRCARSCRCECTGRTLPRHARGHPGTGTARCRCVRRDRRRPARVVRERAGHPGQRARGPPASRSRRERRDRRHRHPDVDVRPRCRGDHVDGRARDVPSPRYRALAPGRALATWPTGSSRLRNWTYGTKATPPCSCAVRCDRRYAAAPWHFLYFLPLPHGQGALRGTLSLNACCGFPACPPSRRASPAPPAPEATSSRFS